MNNSINKLNSKINWRFNLEANTHDINCDIEMGVFL